MAEFKTIRVAAVQATPVILDAEATVDKVIGLLREAADGGATLVVFPECFVSVYPSGAWAAPATSWNKSWDELWERMWASSIDVGGPMVGRLATACAENGVHLAIGDRGLGGRNIHDDQPGDRIRCGEPREVPYQSLNGCAWAVIRVLARLTAESFDGVPPPYRRPGANFSIGQIEVRSEFIEPLSMQRAVLSRNLVRGTLEGRSSRFVAPKHQ